MAAVKSTFRVQTWIWVAADDKLGNAVAIVVPGREIINSVDKRQAVRPGKLVAVISTIFVNINIPVKVAEDDFQLAVAIEIRYLRMWHTDEIWTCRWIWKWVHQYITVIIISFPNCEEIIKSEDKLPQAILIQICKAAGPGVICVRPDDLNWKIIWRGGFKNEGAGASSGEYFLKSVAIGISPIPGNKNFTACKNFPKLPLVEFQNFQGSEIEIFIILIQHNFFQTIGIEICRFSQKETRLKTACQIFDWGASQGSGA